MSKKNDGKAKFNHGKKSLELDPVFIDPALLPRDQTGILESMGIKLIPEPEFKELARIIYDHFGINLTPNKLTLVTGRIHPIMVNHGFKTYSDYIETLKLDKSGEMISELANHISTNHTAFYREESHFKLLQSTVLPEITERKRKVGDRDLRVWCAACSTGEEAYTLEFCLLRHFAREYDIWKAGVLATDISASALAKAKAGIYPAARMESVPLDIQYDYFTRVDNENFAVVPKVKKEVTFRRLNLMNERYPLKKAFDIIFCRNVMIYFDHNTRIQLIERLYHWIEPEGYLFIGHSESVPGLDKMFTYVSPSVYKSRKGE
jgi:Methylase of chemotaxis methyl-accepting proteins